MSRFSVCKHCAFVRGKKGCCNVCGSSASPDLLDPRRMSYRKLGIGDYIFYFRRKLDPKKIRRLGWRTVWDRTRDGIFLTCPQCRKINDASREKKTLSLRRGFIRNCVVCWSCGNHFWVYLHGYGKKRERDYE